jgi:hypothetical protein
MDGFGVSQDLGCWRPVEGFFLDCFPPILDCLRLLTKPNRIPSQHGTTCIATRPGGTGIYSPADVSFHNLTRIVPHGSDSSLALVSGLCCLSGISPQRPNTGKISV